MAIKMSKTDNNEIMVEDEKQYDIVDDRTALEKQYVGSPEVNNLTTQITLDDANSIVTFGSDVANAMSKASDVVLNSMSLNALDDTSKMMDALSKVMDKFDIDEIKNNPRGLQKLFTNAKKQLDKIINKYHTMGDEIDKIYVELKKYESEIKKSNDYLEDMFNSNVNTYHDLVKYILAGEQACKEIESYRDELANNPSSDNFELINVNQALSMMEQRTQDLRTAESVAMQAIPMIKTMQYSNMNLIRKINSAFIITLPVFKQALAQAMLLKRQSIQAESLSKLDEKTNELLIKNAQNTVEQSKRIVEMASTSSIKADTLETTWRTIMDGIKETQQIQENAHVKRLEDKKKLEQIKKEFEQTYCK